MQTIRETETKTETVLDRGQATTSWRDVRRVGLAAAGLAAVTWVLASQVAGVDLVVGAGASRQHVGVASVVVTALVTAYAGGGLLRVLERRTPQARRTWTVVAVLVLVVSLAGPLGAVTPAAGLVLGAMHLEVGAVVVLGLRRRAASERAGRVA